MGLRSITTQEWSWYQGAEHWPDGSVPLLGQAGHMVFDLHYDVVVSYEPHVLQQQAWAGDDDRTRWSGVHVVSVYQHDDWWYVECSTKEQAVLIGEQVAAAIYGVMQHAVNDVVARELAEVVVRSHGLESV